MLRFVVNFFVSLLLECSEGNHFDMYPGSSLFGKGNVFLAAVMYS